MIYLDNAATTYKKPNCVYERVESALKSAVNVGRGSYKLANEKNEIVEIARERILKLNNLSACSVVFTPSATLALNQIIQGIDFNEGDYVYVSPFEHNAVMRPLNYIKKKCKIEIIEIPFDNVTYEVNIEALTNLFAIKKPKAVFCSMVSNVLGLIPDYDKIFELSKKFAAINVLDAAQGYGIVPLKSVSNIDFTVFAGHKSLYGIFGIAGFIVHNNYKLNQIIFGGTGTDSLNLNIENKYPGGFEVASPNIIAIESIYESTNWLMNTDVYTSEYKLTKLLIEELSNIKKLKLYLPYDYEKIFGIVAFNHKDYSANDIGRILSENDICVRTGFHCAPFVHKFIGTEHIGGVVRVSLSYFNSEFDIMELIKCIKEI